MTDLHALVADLAAEQGALDAVLGQITENQWQLPTPAEGWTVAHQVAHLTYFDAAAATAASDPDGFAELRARADADPDGYGKEVLVPYLSMAGPELLHTWQQGRARLADALMNVPAGTRVPWYGPSMSVASMVTARLMETWAHGQDIVDALGVRREPTARLAHVARIACLARPYSYAVNGLALPATTVRAELATADGGTWTFGPDDADEVVRGSLLDFCLVLTQRRHVDDTGLEAEGTAAEWLRIGQAYAGAAGTGRRPGQFT